VVKKIDTSSVTFVLLNYFNTMHVLLPHLINDL
jgi:hypothetical protein